MTIYVDKENCSTCKYADSEHHFCSIRNIMIENNCWTYCMNHPWYNKNDITTAIGPMYDYAPNHSRRTVIVNSPDDLLVKDALLMEANKINEAIDYNINELMRDEVIIWQLGEFKEERALLLLKRIEKFNEKVTVSPPAQVANCDRKSLIDAASKALKKIIKNKVNLSDTPGLFPF